VTGTIGTIVIGGRVVGGSVVGVPAGIVAVYFRYREALS